MKKVIVVFQLLTVQIFAVQTFTMPSAIAGPCEVQLKSLLSLAKTRVNNSLATNSPCYNAAMIGRKNGPPGCFPGKDLSKLLGILNPLMVEVKEVCDSVCDQEDKRTSCYELTSQSRLREIGILGVVDILKYPLVVETNRSAR